MDYHNYYKSQARNEYVPVFHGASFQRGSGFGDVFKNFFRWIIPIVKKNAEPHLKTIAKEALNTVSNIANDKIDGKKLSESSEDRIKETFNKLKSMYGGKIKKNVYKRKKIKHMTPQKRILDIFDKKTKKEKKKL